VRWHRRLAQRVKLNPWETRVRHALRSLLAAECFRRILLPLLGKGGAAQEGKQGTALWTWPRRR
jgi:hypothetical protein